MTKIKVVVGANYGDEGKGLATSYFSSKCNNSLIVLTNGGAQRGHTVEVGNCRHVFHHLGSKFPESPSDTFISSIFKVNPLEFVREVNELNANGWLLRNIYVSDNALVTTPYDMFVNRILEDSRGDNRHGSTGMGIWITYCRSNAGVIFTYNDIVNKNINKILDDVIDYSYETLKKENVNIPKEYDDLFRNKNLRDHFIEDCKRMYERCIPVGNLDFMSKYDEVICENAQGLLLNFEAGNPHTTPSFTGVDNLKYLMGGLRRIDDVEVCYVTRTYLTRHGNGPFPTECDKNQICEGMEDKTNVYNPWQQNIRYGTLNIDELNERIEKDFSECHSFLYNPRKSVMLTHVNEHKIDENKIDGLKYISSSKYANEVQVV